MHAALKPLEARAALVVERDELAVDDRLARPQRAPHPPHLRVLGADVAHVAALQLDPAAAAVGDRAHAVPLDLVAVGLVVARHPLGQRRAHRLDALGHRLAARHRRVHAVDHPVVALGPKQRVAARHALAAEDDDDLGVLELLELAGAAVPDRHLPGPVLARGDLALEVDVLERMVLRAHGEPVLLRVERDALGQRPRREHAFVLDPQVPVQPAGVVLLDHEARRAGPDLPPRGSGVASNSRFDRYSSRLPWRPFTRRNAHRRLRVGVLLFGWQLGLRFGFGRLIADYRRRSRDTLPCLH